MVPVVARLLLSPTPQALAWWAPPLRAASGAILIAFGAGKFLDHASEAASFTAYGLPRPGAFVYAVGAVELGFGVLLVAGLATRAAALVLAGNLAGAIATAGPVEGGPINLGLAPALLAAMLVLVWSGGGRLALDGLVKRRAASGNYRLSTYERRTRCSSE